ncbi:MAG TPA: AAA family ATPase [Acidimicrobiales bacterium]|nr:AAA family ATPase [Acidimicrobiales bacterium]
MDSPLSRPVESFVREFAPVLVDLVADLHTAQARKPPLAKADKLPEDVALEAFNLVAAFIDADGRHTDEELWAFIHAFAGRFDTVARAASPPALRAAGLLAGRRTFLDTPSPLFEVLVRADVKRRTSHAWRYYLASIDIAHAVFALDDHPSHAELTAVERFRSMLLRAMDQGGVPRPGGPPAPTPTTGGASEAAAEAEPDEPLEPPRPLEELLAELDGLVGLAAVKAEVKLVTNLLRVEKLRTERGMPVVEHSRHLVFTGNPGTGKTTVARLLAQIYRTLGVVEKGQLVETDRSGLVAGYIGQTAIKVKEVFTKALGGVLLIDEAHALARGEERDFGHEAIDMIVKLMEDHRDDVVLIVAGYPDEMATFLDANPGLRSRFPKTIFFDDYSNEELVRIFVGMAEKSHYKPTEEAQAKVLAYVSARPRDRGFGNARMVRNLFEAAVSAHASRVVELGEVTDEALVTLEAADIPSP